MNIVLWIIQILLGLLFLFAGASKFFMSADDLAKNMPSMSMAFLHFIGVCEFLGGIGLIVPWVTKIKPILTPVAALGLLIIMIGAVVVSVPMGISNAVFPAVIGCLLIFVAWGRKNAAA